MRYEHVGRTVPRVGRYKSGLNQNAIFQPSLLRTARLTSGSFIGPWLGRKFAVDLLCEPIQAALAAEKSSTIAEDVGELLFDVAEHFCAERNAVIGEQRIEFGCGEYHI